MTRTLPCAQPRDLLANPWLRHASASPRQCAHNVSSPHRAAYSTRACSHRRRLRAQASASGTLTGPSWDAPPVVVAGGGIAGLSTALALHKVGIPVTVLESAADPRRGGEGAAIGLWENAWCALDVLGVGDTLRKDHVRINRVDLVTAQGRNLRSFSFQETDAGQRPARRPSSVLTGPSGMKDDGFGTGSEFRGVRRSALLQALADALPAGIVKTNTTAVSVRHTGSTTSSDSSKAGSGRWAAVELSDGSALEASVVVGADGVRSAVAGPRGLDLPPANYANYTAYRGVATLPGGVDSISLPLNTVRQVWGKGLRAGLYPLNDREVYWFTCFNADEGAPIPPDKAAMQTEALSQVRGWSWGLETAINNTPTEGISRGRVVDRWTVGPIGKGLVTLAGDALHPMTPNLGQGGCVALEDSIVLARTLSQAVAQAGGPAAPALEAALRTYEKERSARCLPLTVRSYAMGFLLQLPYEPVLAVRDLFVSTLFSPSHFLDHTTFDCGTLTGTTQRV